MPTASIQPQADFVEGKSTERPRLHFLDGMRGVAAFLVVIFHMWQRSFEAANSTVHPMWFRILSVLLKNGHCLVAVFIVLSGFCLMLPVVQANGMMKGGALAYIKRRARRILPPYYAALALAVTTVVFVPAARVSWGSIYDPYQPQDVAGSLITHLLLLHNLAPQWAFRFDAPLWSVATEWQIYFLFPLILLPAWRRWGAAAPIAIGLTLGLCTAQTILKEACFWYIGLFAMGMAVCALCFPTPAARKSDAWSWPTLWAIFAAVAAGAEAISHKFPAYTLPSFDVVAGILTSYLIFYSTHQATSAVQTTPLLVRIFSARPMVGLGTFSYSLYLIHFPIVFIGLSYLRLLHFSAEKNLLIYLSLGLPLILAAAYLFHRVFERPFMNIPKTQPS